MKNKNQKGFTLIELLIVIGIIAILAAAVIIAINPGRQFEQAREATRWSHVNSIANAVYSYAIDNGGNFPACNDVTAVADLGDGDDLEDEARDVYECEDELIGTDGTYMAAFPLDPQDGTAGGETGYDISSDGTRIRVTSGATESEVEITQ
jgi:prepilin-type N-terminal cleavage/methylation domain-containing protein